MRHTSVTNIVVTLASHGFGKGKNGKGKGKRTVRAASHLHDETMIGSRVKANTQDIASKTSPDCELAASSPVVSVCVLPAPAQPMSPGTGIWLVNLSLSRSATVTLER